MARFMINVTEAQGASMALDNVTKELQKIEQQLDLAIRAKTRALTWPEAVERSLGRARSCKNKLSAINTRLSSMKQSMDDVVKLYTNAERKIVLGLPIELSQIGDTVINGAMRIGDIVENWWGGIKPTEDKIDYEQIMESIQTVLNSGIGNSVEISNAFGAIAGLSFYEGSDDDSIASKYWDIFSGYIGDKFEKYFDTVTQSENAAEVVVDWYDWFTKDMYGDLKQGVSLLEDLYMESTFREANLLGKGGKFFSALSSGGILIDAAKEIKAAVETGDWSTAYKNIGTDVFKEVVKRGNKYLDKIDNLKYIGVDKQAQSVLVNTIISMPIKWIEEVEEYAKNGNGSAGTIVTEVVIGSAIESAANAASPVYVASTALTYPVIDEICEVFGYDLSSEYERLTGKTGLSAVFAAQKELWVDIVYEGAKEGIAKGLDAAYNFVGDAVDGIKKGWNWFTSGVKSLFGG